MSVRKTIAVGVKYGRLTAIAFSHTGGSFPGRKSSYWKFSCECGKETVVKLHNVLTGNTKSCGCFLDEARKTNTKLPDGVSAINTLFSRYRKSAQNKNREFSLTKEQFHRLIISNCHYCGAVPQKGFVSINYNGIDRKYNDIGYTIDNCVACCKHCNFAKRNESYDEFISYLDRISLYRTTLNNSVNSEKITELLLC